MSLDETMPIPIATRDPDTFLRFATIEDLPLVLDFIRRLAEYEKLADAVVADEKQLAKTLFGDRRIAEVVIADHAGTPAGFALFFHNFSTFIGKPGIYLEDLFVLPELRGKGIGEILLSYLAHLCVERDCGRFEWAVLDWNEPAIGFYKRLGAEPIDEWTTFRVSGDQLPALAKRFGHPPRR
ncbi:MAG: GNAT family N-acetyltransferase [Thermoanaerobaculia bacterium]